MTEDDEKESGHRLPARSPDLVVAEESGGEWRILRISSQLARAVGKGDEGEAVAGRSLSRLCEKTVPPLADLARESLERQRSLTDIPVHFPGSPAMNLAVEVHPGGLTPDYAARTVTFTFRETRSQPPVTFSGLVGSGPALREVFRKISLYAPSDAAVVVTGETGTGKELVARALHDRSSRHQGPYVAVNCSAISEDLLESELFGHEKGAFTGAVRSHRGRFERADGGTLFLDEIGDMPLHTQAKLLRVLEEGVVERVGAEQGKRVDVRVVAATNVPLEKAVAQGRFRPDLYHRLSVLRIHLPPLRSRPEDIPALVEHFLEIFSRKYRRRIQRLTPEAISLLQSYLWPGNVRELRNVLERVFVETPGEIIGARAFREWIRERQDFSPGSWSLESLETRGAAPLVPPYPLLPADSAVPTRSGERSLGLLPSPGKTSSSTRPAALDADEIRKAYRAAEGNLTAAARMLGVHRATLYRYLEKLGLDRKDLEKERVLFPRPEGDKRY